MGHDARQIADLANVFPSPGHCRRGPGGVIATRRTFAPEQGAQNDLGALGRTALISSINPELSFPARPVSAIEALAGREMAAQLFDHRDEDRIAERACRKSRLLEPSQQYRGREHNMFDWSLASVASKSSIDRSSASRSCSAIGLLIVLARLARPNHPR